MTFIIEFSSAKSQKITLLLNKQKLKFKTKVNQLLPLPFLRLTRKKNVSLVNENFLVGLIATERKPILNERTLY